MKVLLVVDMQKGFIKGNKNLSFNKKVNEFIKRSNYDKYIFTKFKNDKTKNSLYHDKIGWCNLTTEDEQVFSVDIPDNVIIMEKFGYGLEKNDLDYIKSLGITEIDICGLKAEACVYAISLQLWDSGIFPSLLTDYIIGDVDMKDVYIKQFGNVKNQIKQ